MDILLDFAINQDTRSHHQSLVLSGVHEYVKENNILNCKHYLWLHLMVTITATITYPHCYYTGVSE